ncbi:GNAT family N-acetyltransferase [Streptomyces sp. NPDC003300]|uniref:GNAT family N-acetyltransferase n=1 Tax=unclassified Streptomyces TaxID=2593676 RepID=UPI0033B7ECC8
MSSEVFRDAWGIPHLRADSARELAFAQGRNAAVDRAWQLETERHRAEGGTAAFLGADAVEWDRFARRALLADTARRCHARLDQDTARWVAAYVDGVNAGLPQGAAQAPEFAATGLAPGRWQPWTPLAVWLSTHILFAGFPAKLWRYEAARRLGPDAVAAFATDGPGTAGSNGWLITGDRTATGAALLAGDPHRFIEAPGVYQQIRLACPEFDVVGLAVPGVPGLAHFGHTGRVAWAITNAMADYQDLYRERLRRAPDGSVRALGPDGWEPAASRTETVAVADADPVRVEIVETARGPVIIGGPDAPENPDAPESPDAPETPAASDGGASDGRADTIWNAVSLRCPARAGAELGFSALPSLLRATTVGDVDRALDGWVEPVNVVQAADTEGGLLHRTAGRVPVRHPDNSLYAVPAWRKEHAWTGAYAPLPRADVRDGLAVMANARELAAPLGTEFAAPHRARRIRRLLASADDWTADGMGAIHTDVHLGSARALLDHVADLQGPDTPPLSPAASALGARLLRWDRRMAAESTDAASYAVLRAAVVRGLAAHPALAPLTELVHLPSYPATFTPWLALVPRVAFALETLLGGGLIPARDRAAIVRAALEETAGAGAGEAGAGERTWGELHRLAPWQALPPDAYGHAPEVWPGLAGDHDCVLSTSSVPGITHHSLRGPAARYVWDLADRENSRWVVPFGASGVPGGPHHRDQLPYWLRGDLVPVVTDWTRLTRETSVPEAPKAPEATEAPAAGPAGAAAFHGPPAGFGTVRFVPVDPDRDIDLIHAWVTQERGRFWGMGDATRDQVREIYAFLDSLDTHHAYLVRRDDRPVALFQAYQPEADPIGDFYDRLPGDVGVHVFVGPIDPGAEREPDYTRHLLTALLAHVFADPACRRIVAEPDARNTRAIDRLLSTGFTLGPRVELPDKPAQFVFLTRDLTTG